LAGPERLLFIVADVAGKASRALLMATLQASPGLWPGFDLAARIDRTPQSVCLYTKRQRPPLTTAFVAELEPSDGRLTYVNAGITGLSCAVRRTVERLEIGAFHSGSCL